MNSTSILLASNLPFSTHSTTYRRHFHRLPAISTSLSSILRNHCSFPHFLSCHPKLCSSHSPSPSISTRRPTSSDFAKSLLTSALFGVAVSSVSLFCLLTPLPLHASVAAPSVEEDQLGKMKERGGGGRRHEYEDYTDELLETASVLVRRIEEVRKSGNGDLESVENALLDVKKERTRISEMLVGMLREEMRVSGMEKCELLDRLEIVFQSGLAAVKEQDHLLKLLEIAKKKREEGIKKREEEANIINMASMMEEEVDGVEMADKKIEVFEEVKGDVYKEAEGFRVFEEKNVELEKVNREISDLQAIVIGLEGEKQEGKEDYNVLMDAKITPLKRRIQNLEKKRKKIEEEDVDKLNEKITVLEITINDLNEEYNGIWERIDELDDEDDRKETMLGSIGIKELNFVVKESEILVEKFRVLLNQERSGSHQKDSIGLSKHQIVKDLESVQKKYLEQTILPQVIDVKKESEQIISNTNTYVFMDNIKKSFKDSRQTQRNLENHIRKKFKGYGEERSFFIKTPDEEIVKGFPEVELKWMFGQKEVTVPKAHRLRLLHGWKKWREEAKANLKKDLIKNPEHGRQYIAQRQESILTDRDRLVSKTYFNDEKKRWEMNPDAVPYAVSKKLLDRVRIRHDWAAMFVSIKGDDEEYFVDIKLFDLLYEDSGGFDALYVKLMASGIPTVVHFMRIPLAEMNIRQQIFFIARVSYTFLKELWKTKIVTRESQRVFSFIKDTNDDFLVTFVFPVLEFVIPLSIKERIGMAWPEEVDQFLGSTWYLKWQTESQESYASRQSEGIKWYLWVFIRCIVYAYVLFHIIRFMKRRVPRLLGFGPYRIDPNLIKLGRVKYYFNFKKRKVIRKKKQGFDPIKSAFDEMKRVKNPPIQLDEFASIDSMKEEINEVVEFLQNPTVFMEMGARAPRGVLLVGERGIGKTSLALAIAAKAKVPLVEIKANQLEAGLWVGQSASNVRELFQTARDMAPVIIFVEDFDQFAGVRGKFIHTKKQDHEAFINQLLVELDGFEKQEGVVLLATTRNLNQIDPALQRPGRMDRIIHLQRPTQLEREKILRIAAEDTMDKNFIEFVNWTKVAEKTSLLRPIELRLVPMSLEGTAFRNKFLDVDELMTYCEWFAECVCGRIVAAYLSEVCGGIVFVENIAHNHSGSLDRETFHKRFLMQLFNWQARDMLHARKLTFSNSIPDWMKRSPPGKMLSEWLVNHLGLTLTREDLESVVDLMEPYGQITNGIDLLSPSLDWTREVKFPHAVWAAGRSLIALLLPNFDVVENLWLEPTSWEGIGCTKITKAKGFLYGNVETRSYLEKRLVFCFGSYIASQMLLPFGEENMLCSAELEEAQEIATRMVIQYGWGPDDSAAIYFCSNADSIVSMGNAHELELAKKVEKMYNLAFDKAEEILMKNRKVLENTVEDLIQFENLTRKDLHDIIEKNGGIFQQEPFSLCLSKIISDDDFNSDANGSNSNLAKIIN